MLTRRRAAWQTAGAFVWVVAVAAVFLSVVYPRVPGGRVSVAAQVVAYLLTVIPLLVLRPRVGFPLGASRVTVAAAVAVLVAAVAFAGIVLHESVESGLSSSVRAVTAGVGEELVFRGAIYDRLGTLSGSVPVRVGIDAILFTAYHVPLVLLQSAPPAQLIVVLVLGTVFSVARVCSRGLLLPIALHVAVDLSG